MTIIKLLLIIFFNQPVQEIYLWHDLDNTKYMLVVDEKYEEIPKVEAFFWYMVIQAALEHDEFEQKKTPI